MPIPPDLPLGVYCQKQALDRLQDVRREMRRVRHDQQADAVHDLRVSIRRFSSVLQVFPECFPPKRAAKGRKRLKRVLKAAGKVRDHDIALSLADHAGDARLEDGRKELEKQRKRAARKLRRVVSKRKRQEALTAAKHAVRPRKALRGTETSVPWRPAAPACQSAVERLPFLIGELFDAGRQALHGPLSAGELHQLRLRTKRRRYTLELFLPCYGPEMDDRIAQLKRLQDLLGEINDCRASRDLAQSEEERARLDARRDRLIADFGRFWITEFDAPGECESWMLELARRSSAHASAGR